MLPVSTRSTSCVKSCLDWSIDRDQSATTQSSAAALLQPADRLCRHRQLQQLINIGVGIIILCKQWRRTGTGEQKDFREEMLSCLEWWTTSDRSSTATSFSANSVASRRWVKTIVVAPPATLAINGLQCQNNHISKFASIISSQFSGKICGNYTPCPPKN